MEFKTLVYHGTSYSNWKDIIRFNCLFPVTKIRYMNRILYGISTSRSKLYSSKIWRKRKLDKDANQQPWVVITLNLDRIKETHKAMPINYQVCNNLNFNEIDEMEEFIIGRLYPLDYFIENVDFL